MRQTLFAAAAALAISTPAIARDGSPYIGIEAGPAMSDEGFFDLSIDDGTNEVELRNAVNLDYKIGLDADIIGGYDFGLIRAEAEVAYKSLGIEDVTIGGGAADDFEDDDFGSAKVTSLMGNLLFDFGGDTGFGAYVGGGLGPARVKIAGESDSGLAWQGIGGVRTAITPNVDLGLKYRYFVSSKLRYRDELDGDLISLDGRLKTHSLLLSLIYNFAAPALLPPPPPPSAPPIEAPATQTCPDGTVILATEACPAPPPPPPPPPAGERG